MRQKSVLHPRKLALAVLLVCCVARHGQAQPDSQDEALSEAIKARAEVTIAQQEAIALDQDSLVAMRARISSQVASSWTSSSAWARGVRNG